MSQDNKTLSLNLTSEAFHCTSGSLLGPLGLFVQALLAFLAFSALIVKRFCEPPAVRRSWKIWFFDTAKQAIGAAIIHFANIFLAEVFTGDPCTWYIVSFLLDSTVGLFVIYFGLRIALYISLRKGYYSLIFGEYGDPPKCNAWIGQCGVYILVMVIEKILMTLLVLPKFWQKVRYWILYPIKNPQFELIIVMFIVPFVVNAIVFWVVDNFLKKSITKKSSVINSNSSAVRYFNSVKASNLRFRDSSDTEDLLGNKDGDEKSSEQRGLNRKNQKDEYSLFNDS